MYTDPGLGSLLIQILLGAVLGVPLLVGIFWTKIKGILHRIKKHDSDN